MKTFTGLMNILSLFIVLISYVVLVNGQACVPAPLVCTKIDQALQMDADLSDWTDDETSLSAPAYHAILATKYEDGNLKIRCRYSSDKMYLALEVPGLYRFNATDNHQCSAIATMMKIGANASFINMGGCPDARSGCDNGVPASCDSYRVDIGTHWELMDTKQGIEYNVSLPGNGTQGSGDDLVANKDDEYAVSPFCRFDDDDADAANEWTGAWSHSAVADGEPGAYIYELSRLLKTSSAVTDAQLSAGETYSFGIAFWDPYETADGWTDIGHYVTGCGTDWIDLVMADDTTLQTSGGSANTSCTGSETLRCDYVETLPVLDGDLNEWTNIESTTTSIYDALNKEIYTDGAVSLKCMYTANDIFLSLEVPGLYRFNATDNHQCAAIATMMKIGQAATFVNMGGCPDAPNDCTTVPDTCNSYRVDIGAHWQLMDTTQKQQYGVNGGTGNDLVANKDDEYAVSPSCRLDDDDTNAANEWSGAWAHTNPVEGEPGKYIFELSRSLTTKSTTTDAQLVPGATHSFGVAFWDPFETADGWTDTGHFVTGCGVDWFNLELAPSPSPSNSIPQAPTPSDSASPFQKLSFGLLLAVVAVPYLY